MYTTTRHEAQQSHRTHTQPVWLHRASIQRPTPMLRLSRYLLHHSENPVTTIIIQQTSKHRSNRTRPYRYSQHWLPVTYAERHLYPCQTLARIIRITAMHTLCTKNVSIVLLSACMLTSIHTFADSVYKSIDKNGKITYSTAPTKNHEDVSKIDISPPPSEKDIDAAIERHQQNLKTDKMLEQSRQQRSREIAEKNRLKRKKKQQDQLNKKPEEPKEEDPYYGIPGHGILVLPKGPQIQR